MRWKSWEASDDGRYCTTQRCVSPAASRPVFTCFLYSTSVNTLHCILVVVVVLISVMQSLEEEAKLSLA